jgi:hypothetical protein
MTEPCEWCDGEGCDECSEKKSVPQDQCNIFTVIRYTETICSAPLVVILEHAMFATSSAGFAVKNKSKVRPIFPNIVYYKFLGRWIPKGDACEHCTAAGIYIISGILKLRLRCF